MQSPTDIPQDVLDIVDQCIADPDAVSWSQVERVAAFFEQNGVPDLAAKMRQIHGGVVKGKYNVIVDQDNVVVLELTWHGRVFKFPYTIDENLDDVVTKLIDKHNLAHGYSRESAEYAKVFGRLKRVIGKTTAQLERRPQIVYSEDHLDRPPSPTGDAGERLTRMDRPRTPIEDDIQSARDVQESIVRRKRKKMSSSSSNSSLTCAPPRPNPPIPRRTKTFTLQPRKQTARNGNNFWTIETLSRADEKSAESRMTRVDRQDDDQECRGHRTAYELSDGRATGSTLPVSMDDVFDDEDVKTPIEFSFDPNAPKIAVRIRLKSDRSIDVEFNTNHTVGDVRNFLNLNHPVSGSYKLLLGFPRRVLADDSENVVDAQLENSQLLQR